MYKLTTVMIAAAALTAFQVGAQTPRFSRDTSTSSQPMVTDNMTGLIWQGCALGLSGDTCATGSPTTFNWENALAGCENLSWGGFTDWRLPNRKELRSIVDNRVLGPSIDTVAFPATTGHCFWSSSSCPIGQGGATCAYCVDFQAGHVQSPAKQSESNNARCVRGGP